MTNRNGVPAMQPKMQAIPVLDKKDWIVCQCGGRGIIYQAAFLVKSMLVGSKPEIAPVVAILCISCGEPIDPPFTTAGDIKEAT